MATLEAKLERSLRERVPWTANEAVRDLLKLGSPEAAEALLRQAADAVYFEDAARLRRHILCDRYAERFRQLEENDRRRDPTLVGLIDEIRQGHKTVAFFRDVRVKIYAGVQPDVAKGALAQRWAKSNQWLERALLADLACDPASLYGPESEPSVKAALIDRLAALKLAPPEEALGSEHAVVRLSAVSAMRTIGDPRFLDALVPLHGADGRFGWEVQRAVREISKGDAPNEPGKWAPWWKENRERVLRDGFAPADGPGRTRQIEFFSVPLYSRHAAFVVDCSESMKMTERWSPAVGAKTEGGRRVDMAQFQLTRTFQTLPEASRFSIVLFSSGSRPFDPATQALNPETRKKALEFVARLPIKGDTDIFGGLDRVLPRTGRAAKDGLDTIYLLTDGEANEGPFADLDVLLEEICHRNRFAKIAIHSIYLGGENDQAPKRFMQDLASRNGGTYTKATLR